MDGLSLSVLNQLMMSYTASALLQPPTFYTVTHTFLLNLSCLSYLLCCVWPCLCSYLCPCFVCATVIICCYNIPVSTQGSFKVLSYLMKDVLPHRHALKLCASAPVDLGVCMCGCVCCVRAPLSAPKLYIIPGDDISEAWAGPSGSIS